MVNIMLYPWQWTVGEILQYDIWNKISIVTFYGDFFYIIIHFRSIEYSFEYLTALFLFLGLRLLQSIWLLLALILQYVHFSLFFHLDNLFELGHGYILRSIYLYTCGLLSEIILLSIHVFFPVTFFLGYIIIKSIAWFWQ